MAPILRRIALSLLLLALAAPALRAGTFVVPPDGAMFRAAHAVAVVEVLSYQPRIDDDGEIVTDIRLRVTESLKGNVAGELTVTEMGGIVGSRARAVSGAPDYFPGERALVFLAREQGIWRTLDLLLGKFSFVTSAEGEILVRGATEEEIFGWNLWGERHTEVPRNAQKFLGYLRALAAGVDLPAEYFVHQAPPAGAPERDYIPPFPERPEETPGDEEQPAGEEAPSLGSASAPRSVVASAHYPPSAYAMKSGAGDPFRWKLFDDGGTVSYRITGAQPGYDSVAVADAALAAWTNDSNSNVRLRRVSGAGGQFVQDQVNSIVYDNSSVSLGSAIGLGQVYAAGQHGYKGETFWTVVEGDVVMKAGLSVSAKVFLEAVTHEVGHTIALRHSDQGTPATNDAIMNSIVSGKWGATLSPYDKDAVSHLYTASSGGTAPPPTFTFTDDPLLPGTVIKAVHLQQLRNAVNSLRAYAGLGAASWTDPSLSGVTVKAIHLTQLRDRLNEARRALGLAPVSLSIAPGDTIRASHIQALRNGVRV